MKTEDAITLVTDELEEARRKFPAFNSPHEGYAVIQEELEELWEDIKTNKGGTRSTPITLMDKMRDEAKQVVAMGLRFMIDCT